MMKGTDYQLDVQLKEILWQTVFNESYKVVLPKDFVANTNPKEHGFKAHVHWLVQKLLQNTLSVPTQASYRKWQIFVVSYGMNIGSEINGDRPSIIYKASHSTRWDDVIVIPLTSALREKLADKYDILVAKDDSNKLYQNSYARLRQVRSVSIRRLGKSVGEITDEKVREEIDRGVEKMLGMPVVGLAE